MRAKRYTLIGLAFYLTYIGGASYYAVSFPIRVLHHVIITLLLTVWLVGRLRKGRGLPESGLNAALYATIPLWALTAVLGLAPRLSLEWLWFGLIHTLFFLYIVKQIRRGTQRLVIEALFFMAMGVLLLSVLELGSWFFGWGIIPGTQIGWIATGQLPRLTDIPQIALPMAVSTLVAGYTAPLVLVAGVWASTTGERAAHLILGMMAVLLMGVLILTSSRGGALSIGAAVGALILMRLVQNSRLRAVIPPRVLVVGTLGVIVAALIGVIVISLPNSNSISNRDRLLMWRSAINLTTQDPLTGVGAVQFGRAFRSLRDPFLAQDKLASAHNFYLNTLAETGVLGLLLCGLLALLIARQGWRNWQIAPNDGTRRRIEAVFAALIGIAVHSLFDVFTITPIVLLIVALVAYGITPQPASRLDPVPPGDRRAAWAALMLVLIMGGWMLWQDVAQNFYMQSWDMSRPTEALANIRTAQALDPALTLYRLQEAYLIAQTGTPQEGIAAYQSALALEPTWDTGWLNLAALQEQMGDLAGAAESLKQAYAIKIDNGSAVHLGRIGETLGWVDDTVVAYYRRAFESNPRLPLADFWHETPLRLRALNEFVPLLALDGQYRVWAVHDPSRLAALIPSDPHTAAEWWVVGEHALTVEHDAPKAADAFTQAIALAPREGDYFVSRARATLDSDPQAARHDLDLARVYGTRLEYPNAVEAQMTTDAKLRERLQVSALPFRGAPQEFAAVLYGRPAVFDVLPAMRDPGYGTATMQPWLDLLHQARAEGDTTFAAALEDAIHQNSPYTVIP